MSEALWRDPRFWAAVVALVQAVLFYLAPEFPEEIWAAVNALAAVVFGSLAARGVAARRAEAADGKNELGC